jgi:olefin beta-lactone synthetase
LPAATAAAKIRDKESFWHRMGDMGYLDAVGGLYFCGRRAHAVRHGGKVFYSVPVERIFNQHSRVKRSALVAWGREGEPAIVIEPYPQYWPETEEARRNFMRELRELAGSSALTSSISRVFFHPAFPVDARHNAKIFRDKLGAWAGSQPLREEEA